MHRDSTPLPGPTIKTVTMADKEKGLIHWGKEAKRVFIEAGPFLKRYRLRLVGLALGTLALVFALAPVDRLLLALAQGEDGGFFSNIAPPISEWGDFTHSTVPLILLAAILGFVIRKPSLQRFALVLLLTSLIASATALSLRFTVGRPRPSTEVPDRPYWFEASFAYSGFPSAHTSNSFATATVIAVFCPPLALPAYAGASLVGWSRLQINSHRPTDVLGGAVLGTTMALILTRSLRRRNPSGVDSPNG